MKSCWEAQFDKDWEVLMGFINKEVFLARAVWLREVGVEARLPWSEGVGGEEREGGREHR